MKRTILVAPLEAIFAALLTAALTGCAQAPLSQSSSNWHENDVIARDLAAQLYNPSDLTGGHGDATVPAQPLVAAITSWSTAQAASSATTASPSLNGLGGGGGAGTP
jgi:type IV pilus biogenesis protein CpaD/CtpE